MSFHSGFCARVAHVFVERLDNRILLSFNASYFDGARWTYEAIRGTDHGTFTEHAQVQGSKYLVSSTFSYPDSFSSSETTFKLTRGKEPAEISATFGNSNETIDLKPDEPIPDFSLSKAGDSQTLTAKGQATLSYTVGAPVVGKFSQTVTETLVEFEDVDLPNGLTFQAARHVSEDFVRVMTFSSNGHKLKLTFHETSNEYSNGSVEFITSTTDHDDTTVLDGKTTTVKETVKLRLSTSSLMFSASQDTVPGQLLITGSAQSDRMKIYRDGDQLVVQDNGILRRFNSADVTSVFVNAGNGNDAIEVDAGVGATTIAGEAGDDWIQGGDGNDSIVGGPGNDTLFGGAGNDQLLGEKGNDKLYGQSGRDLLEGREGDDLLDGGSGVDELHGGDGNDSLLGGGGNDKLFGGGGNDKLFGDTGKDTLNGQAGDDVLD